MQQLVKSQAALTGLQAQLADVEKLIYSRDPGASAALQALDATITQTDVELTAFEKLMEQDGDGVIKFNLSSARRFN